MTRKMELENEVLIHEDKVIRREISFPSQNVQLKGWIYLPADRARKKSPGIVTANALTAVKEITLPGYAERFAAAGFVTLVFDYRFWGESEGRTPQPDNTLRNAARPEECHHMAR